MRKVIVDDKEVNLTEEEFTVWNHLQHDIDTLRTDLMEKLESFKRFVEEIKYER